MMRMSGKSLLSALPIINKQWMRMRSLMTFTDAENFMHESCTVMQPDYVGKPEDLYLWCLIGESKTCRQYACPMRYSCGCDTVICITETKQSLKLETVGVHDRHSHIGGRMHARKSAPGAGNLPPDQPQRNAPSPACSQQQAPSRCRAHCHWRRKRSCTSGSSSPRPGYAQCPYSTAQLEAAVLKQVPRPPSAAYAAGQDYAA
jgi:hypothetical protein